MSTKIIYLTDGEREELRTKYAEDKLNNPPANISDKTLIDNYGDDGQRGRLSIENFDVRVLTDPNFQTHPKAGDEEKPEPIEGVQSGNDANVGTKSETPIKSEAELKAETELAHQTDLYKQLHEGIAPDASWDVGTITAENISKQNANANLPNADPKAAEFAKLFNDYLRLTGNRPFSGWDLEQLKLELENEIETRADKIKADSEARKKANLIPEPANDEQIKLKHKDSGREITVTKQAYENFIAKNQPEWVKVAPVPKELQ